MQYEFRCPIHGFIEVSEWERGIIDHWVFQRLRRIRQLGWTDYTYPGAMHTRFEHSLGVMHVATRMFDALVKNSGEVLRGKYGLSDDDISRHRQLVRLAALLHDVGHGPFSHVAEDVLPKKADNKRYKHEDYSWAAIRQLMREVIEKSPHAAHGITADEVADFLERKAKLGPALMWADLVASQLDADRMDYLLRDSYHAGVSYGHYDLARIINTLCLVPVGVDKSPRIGIRNDGVHAAEGLVIARYQMFSQVYFHKTRVIYDYIVGEMMKELLKGEFPKPDEVAEYLTWDDWKVTGKISTNEAGPYGKRLLDRDHFREVWHTLKGNDYSETDHLGRAKDALGDLLVHEAKSETSWYKIGGSDVPVYDDQLGRAFGLPEKSKVVQNLKSEPVIRLYVAPDNVADAKNRLEDSGVRQKPRP